ncbi:MAG: tetratricopeptide repeat protein [Myxococcota bacterium]|nr:tetratricopeptide repeat protein [Myxococcota bacterium]
MKPYLIVSVLVGCLAVLGIEAQAAEENEAAAKAAFDKGRQLFGKGDYAGAADAFREANLRLPSWKILFNIGQAEAAAKRYGLALEAFERYIAEGGDDVPEERRDQVIKEIKGFREMVGSVMIEAPDGSEIVVDGVVRGKAPLPGAIKIGAGLDHAIQALMNGTIVDERTVRLSGGERLALRLGTTTPEDEDEEPAAAPIEASEGKEDTEVPAAAPVAKIDRTDSSRKKLNLFGWVGIGVGGALLIGGSITGGMALGLDNELQEDCTQEHVCNSGAVKKIDKRDALATTSTVMFAVGTAAAATGAVLLILSLRNRERADANEKVTVLPVLGPDFHGAAITGRF